MTLHGSKGLEFKYVYMVGVEEGFMPHLQMPGRAAGSGNSAPIDVSEERRLAYVGITRAQRQLTMTGARKRLRFGKASARKPSRFLFEIPEELFQGDRSGSLPELSGDALQEKGRDAFAEMLDLVSRE